MISPYHRRQGKQAAVSSKEKMYLYVLAICFVCFLAAILGFQFMGKSGPKEGGDEGNESVPLVDDEGHERIPVMPRRREEIRADIETEMRSKLQGFQAAGKLLDSSPTDDTEVLEYVVNASMWNFRVTGMDPEFYRELDPVKVAFEPGPFRGRLTSAWGPVEKILPPVPFPGRVKGVEKLHSAIFRTAEGQLYRVTSPLPIEFKPGQWIQVYGIYYRNQTVRLEEEDETAFCLAHVTRLEIERAFPPVTVKEIDPEWASEIGENTYNRAKNLDERPFWLVMNYVKNLGAEGYEKLRRSEGFELEDFGRSAKRLTQDPDLYRFKFVAASGKIVSPVWQDLSSDNPGKIKRMDGAFLIQPSEYVVRLASPRRWSEYDIDFENTHVSVEGVFYKVLQYVPSGAPGVRKIPVIVVTGIYPIEEGESGFLKIVMWVIGALAIGVVGFFFYMAFRDRRNYAEFRDRYLEMRRRREEAKGGKDGPEGDSTDG